MHSPDPHSRPDLTGIANWSHRSFMMAPEIIPERTPVEVSVVLFRFNFLRLPSVLASHQVSVAVFLVFVAFRESDLVTA